VNSILTSKAAQLRAVLERLGRVAVAFSGGVDSSLLVKCALDALGPDNVLIVFGESELLKTSEVQRALQWPAAHSCGETVRIERVLFHPLDWPDFVANPANRCYVCKLRLYSLFRERIRERGFSLLVDGTNVDDLQSGRPGLRAVRELGVETPLAEAGLHKEEVRLLGQRLGLTVWDAPSASCLATRIPFGVKIVGEQLRRIELWENKLEQLGFFGCRVSPEDESGQTVRAAIRDTDFAALFKSGIRPALLHFFKENGVDKVLLDLEGR
jgi:pyridinium-3,5-biscarboxylic acid mononucleotide sulfurtransferase